MSADLKRDILEAAIYEALLEKKKTNSNTAEWVMSRDDFENGWGYREYPFCSNCHRGVYRHDAGKWCPFCGKQMRNPMVT